MKAEEKHNYSYNERKYRIGDENKKLNYWLVIDGRTIPQWKKPFTKKGKSHVFRLMRRKAKQLGARKFEIFSPRMKRPLWESGPWDIHVDLECIAN